MWITGVSVCSRSRSTISWYCNIIWCSWFRTQLIGTWTQGWSAVRTVASLLPLGKTAWPLLQSNQLPPSVTDSKICCWLRLIVVVAGCQSAASHSPTSAVDDWDTHGLLAQPRLDLLDNNTLRKSYSRWVICGPSCTICYLLRPHLDRKRELRILVTVISAVG